MESKVSQPSFSKPDKSDQSNKIHLFPVCNTGRTQNFASSFRLGTPLKKKREPDSPGEETPKSRQSRPRLLSPIISIQQELVEVFSNDSEIIPTKSDLMNMDLMSERSMFLNSQSEVEHLKVTTAFPFGTESLEQGQANNQKDMEKDIETTRTSKNEAIAHSAIIELITNAVITAMIPLKKEIQLLNKTVMMLNDKVFPQDGQSQLPQTVTQFRKDVPQVQHAQFANNDVRESLLNPPYLNLPSYNPSAMNWGLKNQGRQAKSYSNTLSGNATTVNSPRLIPVLHPAPKMIITENKNPAYELARRCMGFHPITSIDVGKKGGFHEDTESEELLFQEAGKESVRKFLFMEMNMSERCVDDLRIKNVFYPPIGAVSRTLFVEFFSEEEAALVRKSAKNLKTVNGYRSKLVDFIPRSLEERHRAVEREAFKIRQNDFNTEKGTSNVATRIWLTSDIELRVRKKGDPTPWSKIDKVILIDLPAQAPKKTWPKPDMVNRRRPETPRLLPTSKSSTKKSPASKVPMSASNKKFQIENVYTLLEDNCQE